MSWLGYAGPMGDYWKAVFTRAIKDTICLFWDGWWKTAISCVLFFLATGFLAYLGKETPMLDQLSWALAVTTVGILLFCIIFVFEFAYTPFRLHAEISKENANLRENSILNSILRSLSCFKKHMTRAKVSCLNEWACFKN